MLLKTEGAIKNGLQRHKQHIAIIGDKTQDEDKQNTTQKTRRIRNTDTTKNVGRTRVIGKGNQFLFLIRHLLCYSKSSKLKVLLV